MTEGRRLIIASAHRWVRLAHHLYVASLSEADLSAGVVGIGPTGGQAWADYDKRKGEVVA